MLLGLLLAPLVRRGRLTLIGPGDRTTILGESRTSASPDAPPVVVRIADHWTDAKIALDPGRYAGEAYMDGCLIIEEGTIYDLLALIARNAANSSIGGPVEELRARYAYWLRRLHQANPIARSRANVAHHYDLSRGLYTRFLDSDLQYSCAYFEQPDMSLEAAQAAKKRHIVAKLLLRDGQSVLDIGCGWGGFALDIARAAKVDVLGITLSEEQLGHARRRALEAGLADRVRFELADYRELAGSFDRIVSVGMFEHVGIPNYEGFFARIRDRLTQDGVALIHFIGRADGPGTTNPWIRKYIFPGGYSPSLSETMPAIERAGLWTTDIEIWRLHYAETLRHWRARFAANRAAIAALYDERFCRMWEFYLAGSECAFRFQGHVVFQVQLARSVDAVPLVRDYMHAPAAVAARAARAS